MASSKPTLEHSPRTEAMLEVGNVKGPGKGSHSSALASFFSYSLADCELRRSAWLQYGLHEPGTKVRGSRVGLDYFELSNNPLSSVKSLFKHPQQI